MKIEKHYFEVDLHTSKYFNSCWTNVNPEALSYRVLTENPGFCYSEAVAIMTGLFNMFESVVGVILNLLVILAALRNKDIRKEYLTPSILSIAVTDLILSAYVIPLTAIKFLSRDMPFPAVCEFGSFTGHVLWVLSALNLLGIAVLRCFAVFFPWKTKNKCFKYICRIWPLLSWIISIVVMLPTLLKKYGRFGLECRSFMCKIIDVDFEGNLTHLNPVGVYMIIITTIGILIFLLNLVNYFRVSYYSKTMFNQMKDVNMKLARQMLGKEKKVGKMVAIVSASFLMVYAPIIVLISLDEHAAATKEHAMVAAIVLGYSLVVVHPLTYIFCNGKYRNEIKILFRPTTLQRLN